MPIETIKEVLDRAVKYAPYTVLWAFWWIVAQLNWVRKGEKFKWISLFINVVISAWVWTVVWTSLPESLGDARFALTSVASVLSYPLIDIIEKKWLDLLINRYLWKK